MTKELLKSFEVAGRQENVGDPLVITKFFNPTGAGTWDATEYYPDERLFFGYVSIFGDWNDEWGYFSLDELESYKGKFGLGIERDIYFTHKRFSEISEIKYRTAKGSPGLNLPLWTRLGLYGQIEPHN